MSQKRENPVSPFLSTNNIMSNGYFGGMNVESSHLNCIPVEQKDEVVSLRRSVDLGYITSTTIDNDCPNNKYREAEEVELEETERQQRYKDMSAQMKEYNVNYSGLVIIPWEEFTENPRKLNDLFYLENNGHITYDPEEVNVFFHATKMNKPTFGDISENGKAWVVNVEKVRDLEQVRVCLIERVSVFGVTLVRKTSRFGKSDRAPCLVMLDPSMGHSDSIHATIMRCINVMQEGKKFCLEINLNGCVERWCRRITMTTCEAVGAKLVITNGEEQADLTDAENIICCIVCFPIWSVQAGIYKLHRQSQYKDLEIKFDAEELFLHGTHGSVRNQRAKLFREYQKEIFRTKPIEEAGHEFQTQTNVDRHERQKYISVKKTVKEGRHKGKDCAYIEHDTTDINNLLTKDNEKLKHKIQNLNFGNEAVSGFQTQKHTDNSSAALSSNEFHKYSYNPDISITDTEGETVKTNKTDLTSVKADTTTSAKSGMFVASTFGSNSKLGRLSIRENSDSSGISSDMTNENKIKSMMEVESCTMRKELSPIQSARTVNSDIMIITQSNGEETPTGNGSEIDLKTFLKTELNENEVKPKKKNKKHKKNMKPPRPPSKNYKMTTDSGVDNVGFESEIDNKFRRILPSKRRSLESVDTLGSNDCLAGSIDTDLSGRQDSIDVTSKQFSDDEKCNEVLSLSRDTEIDDTKSDCDEREEVKVFQVNNKFKKSSKNNESDKSEGDDSANIIDQLPVADDMSCDDLELSDLDADDEAIPESETDADLNSSINNSSIKRPISIRGSAPYRSNRQKYIGMNTTVRKDRLSGNKSK